MRASLKEENISHLMFFNISEKSQKNEVREKARALLVDLALPLVARISYYVSLITALQFLVWTLFGPRLLFDPFLYVNHCHYCRRSSLHVKDKNQGLSLVDEAKIPKHLTCWG